MMMTTIAFSGELRQYLMQSGGWEGVMRERSEVIRERNDVVREEKASRQCVLCIREEKRLCKRREVWLYKRRPVFWLTYPVLASTHTSSFPSTGGWRIQPIYSQPALIQVVHTKLEVK